MKISASLWCGCALAVGLALAPTAHADGWRGSASILSSYIWRGIPESDGFPVAQGTVSYHGPLGLYGRIFASTLDYRGAHERADFSAGAREMTDSGLGVDAGETLYRFDVGRLNFAETFLRLRFAGLTGAVYRDWQQGNTYVEAGYDAGLGSGIYLILHGGHTFGHTERSYNDYGLGVEKVWPRFTLGLFLTTTNLEPRHLGSTRVEVAFTRRWRW